MLLMLAEAVTFTSAVTPFLPLAGVILGGIIVGLFAMHNRRRGAVENRAPDVNEIWVRQAEDQKLLDLERRLRRLLEDMYRDIRRAFIVYVGRVTTGGSCDLTSEEHELVNKPVPTIEDVKIGAKND